MIPPICLPRARPRSGSPTHYAQLFSPQASLSQATGVRSSRPSPSYLESVTRPCPSRPPPSDLASVTPPCPSFPSPLALGPCSQATSRSASSASHRAICCKHRRGPPPPSPPPVLLSLEHRGPPKAAARWVACYPSGPAVRGEAGVLDTHTVLPSRLILLLPCPLPAGYVPGCLRGRDAHTRHLLLPCRSVHPAARPPRVGEGEGERPYITLHGHPESEGQPICQTWL